MNVTLIFATDKPLPTALCRLDPPMLQAFQTLSAREGISLATVLDRFLSLPELLHDARAPIYLALAKRGTGTDKIKLDMLSETAFEVTNEKATPPEPYAQVSIGFEQPTWTGLVKVADRAGVDISIMLGRFLSLAPAIEQGVAEDRYLALCNEATGQNDWITGIGSYIA